MQLPAVQRAGEWMRLGAETWVLTLAWLLTISITVANPVTSGLSFLPVKC